jgi:iron complex outermembrane receptor protein
MRKRHIFTAALMLSGASAAYAQPQLQEPEPPAGTAEDVEAPAPDEAQEGANRLQIDEIVVTARRRAEAERLQDVPVAVTALSGEMIESRQIIDVQQLADLTPNVQMSEISATPGTANLSIRGMGLTGALPTLESPVGIFVDGVYLGSPQGSIFDLFDLDGIEVLRGPQGTLFGKNVTGGAILLRSRAPSNTWEVRGQASLETGPEYGLGLSVSGPISDTLSFRLTGQYRKDEGFFRNQLNDEPFGIEENVLIRGSLLWRPSDTVSLIVRYEHGESQGQNTPVQNAAFMSRYDFDINVDDAGTFNEQSWDQITGELNVDIGPGTLTNVFGWRKQLTHTFYDSDGTPFRGLYLEFYAPAEQFSNELRYAATIGRLSFTAGLYYFHSDLGLFEQRFLNSIGGGFTPRGYGAQQTADTYAVFAQGDYSITDRLVLTLGARYSHERKNADIGLFDAAADTCDIVARDCVYAFPDQRDSWNSFMPRVGLQYRIHDDFQIYGSWSRAYRAGGYTSRLTSLAQSVGFDQEEVSAFEIGQKADFFDRRLRINTALFYNDFTNLIRTVQAPGPGGVVSDTRNTADATIWGFEGEVQAVLAEGLRLSAFVGYQHGEYDLINFSLRDNPGEVPGTINDTDYDLEIPRLSPWSYGLGASYETDISASVGFRARVNYSYRDGSFGDDANRVRLNNFHSVDAAASVVLDEGRWELTVYGRNLLDEAYAGFGAVLSPAFTGPLPPGADPASNIAYFPGEGRVIGAEVSFRF